MVIGWGSDNTGCKRWEILLNSGNNLVSGSSEISSHTRLRSRSRSRDPFEKLGSVGVLSQSSKGSTFGVSILGV